MAERPIAPARRSPGHWAEKLLDAKLQEATKPFESGIAAFQSDVASIQHRWNDIDSRLKALEDLNSVPARIDQLMDLIQGCMENGLTLKASDFSEGEANGGSTYKAVKPVPQEQQQQQQHEVQHEMQHEMQHVSHQAACFEQTRPNLTYVPLIHFDDPDAIYDVPCPLSETYAADLRNDLKTFAQHAGLESARLDLTRRRIELCGDPGRLPGARAELEGPLLEFYRLRGPNAIKPGEVAGDAVVDYTKASYADLPAPEIESLIGPKQQARAIREMESKHELLKLAVAHWAWRWEEYVRAHPEVGEMDLVGVKAVFDELQTNERAEHGPGAVKKVDFTVVMYFLGQYGRDTRAMSDAQKKKAIVKMKASKEAQKAAVRFWADRWEEHTKKSPSLIGAEREVMKAEFDIMQAAVNKGGEHEVAFFPLVMNHLRNSGRHDIGTWKDYEGNTADALDARSQGSREKLMAMVRAREAEEAELLELEAKEAAAASSKDK